MFFFHCVLSAAIEVIVVHLLVAVVIHSIVALCAIFDAGFDRGLIVLKAIAPLETILACVSSNPREK